MDVLSMLGDASLRLLTPSTCAACDAPVRARVAFCAPCAASVIEVDAAPEVAAIGAYGGALARAIQRLKYEDRPELARPLADVLSTRGAHLLAVRPDVVVPVPLTKARLAERRYNQAALVAARLARVWGLPYAPFALARVRETSPQASLDRNGRRSNVAGAFAASAASARRRVIIVDDVVTTGATLASASAALRGAGAEVVGAAVIAIAELVMARSGPGALRWGVPRSFRWVDSAGIEHSVDEEELRAQLANGTIPKSSLVCEVPGDAWVHAEELDGLAPPPSTAFVPPPPPFVEDVQRAFEGNFGTPSAPQELDIEPDVEAPPPPPPPRRVLAGGTLVGGMVAPPPPPPVAPSTRPMAGGTLVGMAPVTSPGPAATDRATSPSFPPPRTRRRGFLPVVIAAVGLVALIGIGGVVRSLLTTRAPAPTTAMAPTTPSPTFAAPASSPASAPTGPRVPPTQPARPAEGATACRVTKGPVRLALRASKDIPIELAGIPAKGTVALGFSPDGRTARGLSIDPNALVAKPEQPPFVRGFLRHVTPVPTQTGVKWLVDADLPKAVVSPTLSVGVEPAYSVGIADGALVLVSAPGEAPRKLWSLPATVDAMRALPLADAGALIAVRAEGGVYVGRIGTDRTARGELALVSERGQVGAPALGTNGVEIAVTFAWRAGGSDPWTLRLAHVGRSEAVPVAAPFAVTPGGPGGDAFAPSLAGLSDGRWLLAWTEGPSGSRAVRALTLSSSAAPVGEALLLSPGVASAGQANLAVVGADAGLAVFLTTSNRGTYDLWGASLSCS